MHLHLLEDAWGKHMFSYGYAVPTTGRTCLHDAVCTSGALTFIAYLLFFELELGLMTIVKICQGNSHTNFHIRATPLAVLVTKMPSTASDLPLAALVGLLTIIGALVVRSLANRMA